MGVIICQQHGRQSIQFVCEHLLEDIKSEKGQLYKIPSHTIICKTCHSIMEDFMNNTIEEILEMGEEEFNSFKLKESQIKEKPVCSVCVKNAGILL